MILSRGLSVSNGNGEMDADQSVHGPVDDIDCVTGKAFTLTPDAMGRYNCDECGKIIGIDSKVSLHVCQNPSLRDMSVERLMICHG